MRIEVRATNIELTTDVRNTAERRASFAFGRIAPLIRSVTIVLTDVNGPRGGLDTCCRVCVKGNDGWSRTVTDIDHDATRAAACAIDRAERAVARHIGRLRDAGPDRHQRRASQLIP